MSQKINPLQPFLVKHQNSLAPLQMQSLMQLYQPIVGSTAISLYLTLLNQPLETANQSQRVLHAQLIQFMNVGISVCDEARQRLEAVGLLRTYRDRSSHDDWRYQTLLYDLQQPLDIHQFLNNPLLSTTLFKQIGDQDYYRLLRMWQVETIDADQYTEITSSFQDVFYYVKQDATEVIEASLLERQFKQQTSDAEVSVVNEQFDYAKFLRFIMSEGVEHTQLTQALKEHVLTTSKTYELDEVQMMQVVLLAINDVTDQIQLDKIKEIADKKTFFAQKRAPQMAATPETKSSENGNDSTSPRDLKMFPFDYTDAEIKQRHAELIQEFPNFTEKDIHLVVLCEQMPNDAFLVQTKAAKGGFATDNEQFYVRDLLTKTNLAPEIINFLIYYLLVIESKESVYKGDLQRTASEWQQNALKTTGHAIEYSRNKAQMKEKQQVMQAKQRTNYQPYKRRNQREEIIPDWMKNKEQNAASEKANVQMPNNQGTASQANHNLAENEEAIRARLGKLLGEDVNGNANNASNND
ncbi:hypothetical protein GIY11_07185 [Aerococcaceae bacterium DSM 109653]|uniref:DnaD domain-containing protein n=1 Tax=Fundicoccus ignavus TaxID=2664442 RepID=A0A844BVY3_9LACT|nr:DnaD domain protein [Fundicoccus ignavus]MRI81799.1 hypothetical protein [Fundicoccus ignavus]